MWSARMEGCTCSMPSVFGQWLPALSTHIILSGKISSVQNYQRALPRDRNLGFRIAQLQPGWAQEGNWWLQASGFRFQGWAYWWVWESVCLFSWTSSQSLFCLILHLFYYDSSPAVETLGPLNHPLFLPLSCKLFPPWTDRHKAHRFTQAHNTHTHTVAHTHTRTYRPQSALRAYACLHAIQCRQSTARVYAEFTAHIHTWIRT